MTQQAAAPAHTAARDGLSRALASRRGEPIGTPLQLVYAPAYPRPTEATATTFWGEQMRVVLPELVSCEIHRHGVIEPDVTALFIEVVTAGTVVYDVGAHLGYYSLLASCLGVKVHAFEPSKEILPLLASNVGNRAVVAATGLWNTETTLGFKDFGPSHSAINTFLSPKDEAAGSPETTYAVPVTTIDGYVDRTGDVPSLIKIDAEGAELEVLRGAARTLASERPLVTVEVGDAGGSATSRRALDFAAEFGYVPFDMTRAGRVRHVVRETYSYGNILLVPETDLVDRARSVS